MQIAFLAGLAIGLSAADLLIEIALALLALRKGDD